MTVGRVGDGASAVDPATIMSGLPAQLGARRARVRAGGSPRRGAVVALCDQARVRRMHDGSADLALAGRRQPSRRLFLHLGFTALSALSPTGEQPSAPRARRAGPRARRRSRDDKETGGSRWPTADRILAVIRGVGVPTTAADAACSSGRFFFCSFLVAPRSARCRRRVRGSEIAPHEISLVELPREREEGGRRGRDARMREGSRSRRRADRDS